MLTGTNPRFQAGSSRAGSLDRALAGYNKSLRRGKGRSAAGRVSNLSGELEQVQVRVKNCRGLRLATIVALGLAVALPTLTARAQNVTTSTGIDVQASQSSTQTNPSGAVCSLTTVTAAVTSSSGTPSGTVTIEDEASGSPVSLGSQTLNTSGQASFSFALATGPHTLIAVYAGDSTYESSTSVAVSQSITSQCSASFAVTVSNLSPSNTLTAGQSGTATVTITPLSSFLERIGSAPAFITVSCSGLPEQASCTFTPNDLEIVPGENEGVISSMLMQTQEQVTRQVVPNGRPPRGNNPVVWAFLLPGMAGLGGLAWGARRRRWLQRMALVALVGLVTTLGMTACNPLYNYYHHGPSHPNATPAGTYTITITGQSNNGVTAITNSTTMSLTVQ